MPEDNRFAGLSEAVDEDEPEGSAGGTGTAATSEADSSERENSADGEPLASDSAGNATASDSEPEPADSDDPAAFPFDATEKKTVYVRPETLDDLEDARALVDAQLRTDHDVRDLTGREFYDAVFRFAASDTAGLIDEILEAREE